MDEEITPAELHRLLESGAEVEVVDIRPEPQFRQGHIPGSVNVPFARLPQRVEELDGSETVVTVCPIGKSSIQAARLVRSYEGIAEDSRVASLAGGLDDWEYELETDGEEKRERSPF
jgi:rhodanese-related sulfurtransferase